MSNARMRVVLLLAALACAALAACPKPTEYTPPIAVTPGAAARASRISRFRTGAGGGADAGAPGRARVHPLEKGHELGGPNATGKPGDWVLENEEVVFVIDALGGGGGFAESGGILVDAADAHARKDELGQLFTYFGAFPRQGVYSTIDTREERDGSAVVVARGKELYDAELDVTTEYRLAAGDRALLLRTTVKNTGKEPKTVPGLGDAIHWGGVEKVAPGKPRGFKGPSSGPYVGGIGRFASYAITSTEGEIAAISGGAWTDTEQKKNVTIAPGAEVGYERVFVVGQRPDSASIVSELTRASGGEVGAIEIALVDASGKPVPAPAGAKVVLGTDDKAEVLSVVATGEGATIAGEVPPGRWKVAYAPSAGRRGDGKRIDVDVRKDAVATGKLAVSEPTTLKLGPCVDHADKRPVPCKLTVQGSPDPDFGPGHVAGPARNQITLLPGEAVTVALSSGTYRVTASRGPEHELATQELTVPRDAASAPFELVRVVATPGYVAADLHQHSVLSADSAVAMRDRVIANAAEGVEIPIATEHNVVADFSAVAKELALAPFLVPIAGDELTTDSSRKPWGHANVFPLTAQPDRPRGGAPVVRDRSPKDVFAEVRALPGGPKVLTINHPRNRDNGYFNLLSFDPKTGTGSDPAYDGSFDAVEVWSGRHLDGRDRVFEDWFGLLRNAHVVTPVAATDTHGIVGQEAGYPRTYVRVEKDDALDAWDAARTADLVRSIRERRDVVLTNGPFVTATANGQGIGGVARVQGGVVTVNVRVTTASWDQVDHAEIRRVKGGGPTSLALSPAAGAGGAIVREGKATLRATTDDAFVVVVSGKKPMHPVLSGDPDEIAPWAMTGPIWIDADGDGKSLGRTR